MTATDELRRLLDERGVKYDTHGERYGTWYDTPLGGRVYVPENNAGWLHVRSDAMTPEQAIVATLGRKTCRIERRENAWGGFTEHCGVCGADLGCDTRNTQNFCPNCGAEVVE